MCFRLSDILNDVNYCIAAWKMAPKNHPLPMVGWMGSLGYATDVGMLVLLVATSGGSYVTKLAPANYWHPFFGRSGTGLPPVG